MEYKKLAKELLIENNVRFHGQKSKQEVAKFMSNTDIYIQPSLCETFGVKVIEAMACGKPIIATQIPVFEEKINEKIGILVPPNDPQALSQAIEHMLNSINNFDPRIISKFVEDNYSYKNVGAALNKEYHRLINENL